jgi:hypothetical protein
MSSSKSSTATRISRGVPTRLDKASTMLMRLPSRTLRIAKESPVRSVLGAFVIGFVVAKLARFA